MHFEQKFHYTNLVHYISITSVGLMSSRQNTETGGGSNFLCMPHNPEYNKTMTNPVTNRGLIFGTEYQGNPDEIFDMDNNAGLTFEDQNVPCSVCESTATSLFMLPARITCPDNWTREYWGYLVSERSGAVGWYWR